MLAIQMKRPPLRDWVWVSLNSLIAVVFLWLSSAEWREPELKAVPVGVAGPLFIMALWVIRLLVPLLILNTIWLAASIWRTRRTEDGARPSQLFAAMAVCWICLVLFSLSKV
jgi:hypothetical protein